MLNLKKGWEMGQLNYFDIIILSLSALLGLKGLIRGFIKEIFALIGIVGGVFIASRVASDIGDFLGNILKIQNDKTILLIGFLASFVGFWLIAYIAGSVFSKISSLSGLGIFDRIFGFIFGSGKVFLLFAIIIYAASQIESFKKNLDKWGKNSAVYPILLDTGKLIIKLDATKLQNKISNTIDKAVDTSKQTIQKVKDEVIKQKLDEIKNGSK